MMMKRCYCLIFFVTILANGTVLRGESNGVTSVQQPGKSPALHTAATIYPRLPTARTGQTLTYASGDDGDFQCGQILSGARFADNGDGTVTDDLTDLTWVKSPLALSNNTACTWSNALVFCNRLSYAGRTDWRLPNVRELSTVLDYSQTFPALPKGHPFVQVIPPQNYYWTSTTYAAKTNQAWVIDLIWGAAEYTMRKDDTACVWPVRDGTSRTSNTK